VRKLREGIVPTVVWGLVSVAGVFAARAGWDAIYADWERNGKNFSAPPARRASDRIQTSVVISGGYTPPKTSRYTTFAQFTLPPAGMSGKSVGDWVSVPRGTKYIRWRTDDPDANKGDTEIELKLRDGRLIGPVPISTEVEDVRVSDIKALRASNKRPSEAVTVFFTGAP
jgi:hypothetical protein